MFDRHMTTESSGVSPQYDLRPCPLTVVADMCAQHHGYGSAGQVSAYAFAVYEGGQPVAAYAWQPPPPGAARTVCPEAPAGVLALSRMVALPRAQRQLNHVSKPLRRQMRQLIDRTRWPVLITYHDEGEGHTGHVYKCSGWERGPRIRRHTLVDGDGRRVSSYANGGRSRQPGLTRGHTWIVRWAHWACPRGAAAVWMHDHGWRRHPVAGRWRSGQPKHRWTRQPNLFNPWET